MALFSTAIEFDCFPSPLPEVAAGDVVQAVSGFSLEGVVDWAAATLTLTLKAPASIAVARRIILISNG
ncbi:hypothetical protein [Bradyrhizobium sp.]|uniref:hypothetical protein n=1 Tax=Bradyrhizobium sp. TaxID=376 RepID=UPI0025C4AC88|nr:hypothetical protein [Bradyrhizobium sp.]